MQPTPSQIRLQIYVAVAASLTKKWPTQNKADYSRIAEVAATLTDNLLNEYLKKDSTLLEE